MRIVNFSPRRARTIEKYGSRFKIKTVQTVGSEFSVNCIYMGAGGNVGRHRTTSSQLFMIVDGQRWVSTGRSNRKPVKKGDAVWWETGEFHEAGSDDGMTVVVIEYTLSKSQLG